jgi:hypothetical protein
VLLAQREQQAQQAEQAEQEQQVQREQLELLVLPELLVILDKEECLYIGTVEEI